jgi:hypothetical protein
MNTPHAKIFDVVSFPGGDGYQKMIDRIADICGDREDPRLALVLGLKEYQDEILVALRDAGVKDARIISLDPEELTTTRTIPEQTVDVMDGNGKVEKFTSPEKEITTTIELPHSLASVVNANAIVDLYYRGRRDVTGKWIARPKELAVVISVYQNPDNRERYLDVVAKLPVEIFFVEGSYDDEQLRRVDQMVERGGSVALFDSWEAFEATEGLTPIIEQIVNEGETIALGALPKENKTWLMLSAVKALLTGEKFLGHFHVARQAEKVVYFAVETSRGLIKHRLKILGIYDFIREGRLFVRTLSAGSVPDLTDPTVLEAVKGADVFLDTAIRFSEGDENSAGDAKILSAKVQGLIAAGARVVWIAHHAPKSFREATTMSLENMLRGSGDFAASISSAIGLRQLDEKTNTIFVQGVASRDMEPVEPFVICGRPHLNDTGNFLMVKKPGEAGSLSDHVNNKNGRPENPNKTQKLQMVLDLHKESKSYQEIAETVGISKTTVHNWIADADRDEGRPNF